MHRPELSLQRLTPRNCRELVFDDVISVRKAREEHEVFRDLLREPGVEVLGMDALLILSDVDGVYENWGRPDQRLLSRATSGQLEEIEFASDSMGPNVEAACAFASREGRFAVIGNLLGAAAMLEGRAGRRIAYAAPPVRGTGGAAQ